MKITARGQGRDFGERMILNGSLIPGTDGHSYCGTIWNDRFLRFNGQYKLTVGFWRDDALAVAPLLTSDDVLGEARRRLTQEQVLALARERLTQEELLTAADLSDSDKLTLAQETAGGLSLTETVRGMARLLPREERIGLAELTDGDKLDHACEALDGMPRGEALQWIAAAIQRLAAEEEEDADEEDAGEDEDAEEDV